MYSARTGEADKMPALASERVQLGIQPDLWYSSRSLREGLLEGF